jgi:hypothetical protein
MDTKELMNIKLARLIGVRDRYQIEHVYLPLEGAVGCVARRMLAKLM